MSLERAIYASSSCTINFCHDQMYDTQSITCLEPDEFAIPYKTYLWLTYKEEAVSILDIFLYDNWCHCTARSTSLYDTIVTLKAQNMMTIWSSIYHMMMIYDMNTKQPNKKNTSKHKDDTPPLQQPTSTAIWSKGAFSPTSFLCINNFPASSSVGWKWAVWKQTRSRSYSKEAAEKLQFELQ